MSDPKSKIDELIHFFRSLTKFKLLLSGKLGEMLQMRVWKSFLAFRLVGLENGKQGEWVWFLLPIAIRLKFQR